MAVYADCIVKRIDILKDVAVCFFVIPNLKSAKPFSFYQRMEGFDAGIVPRIPFLGITVDHSAGSVEKLLSHVLASAIRVMPNSG